MKIVCSESGFVRIANFSDRKSQISQIANITNRFIPSPQTLVGRNSRRAANFGRPGSANESPDGERPCGSADSHNRIRCVESDMCVHDNGVIDYYYRATTLRTTQFAVYGKRNVEIQILSSCSYLLMFLLGKKKFVSAGGVLESASKKMKKTRSVFKKMRVRPSNQICQIVQKLHIQKLINQSPLGTCQHKSLV